MPCTGNRKVVIIYLSSFMNMVWFSFSHICIHSISLKLHQLFYLSCIDFYKYKNQTLYRRVVGIEGIKIFFKIWGEKRASATSFLSIKPCIIQYKYLYYIEDSYCSVGPRLKSATTILLQKSKNIPITWVNIHLLYTQYLHFMLWVSSHHQCYLPKIKSKTKREK